MSKRQSSSPLTRLFNNTGENNARQRIFDLFVKPLLLYLYQAEKQENWEMLLEEIFCTETRHIKYAYAKVRFKLPGLYAKTPGRPIPGFGPREITAGDPLIVRVDEILGHYDIQLGRDKDEFFFRLTRAEFTAILDKLEFIQENGDVIRS